MKEMAEHEFPVTLGRDFAGVVEHRSLRRARACSRRDLNVAAQPTPAGLLRLAGLLDSGTLQVSLQQSSELDLAGTRSRRCRRPTRSASSA
jgi:hypothetical protein